MQTFHSFIKKSCIFFLILTIASITMGASYMVRHNISPSAFLGDYEYLAQNYNYTFLADNMASAIFSSDRSSDYETRIMEDASTFALPTELFITSDIEKITFIEEDRNDLYVEYYREIPDTNKYQVNYDTHLEESRLYISSSSSTNNLAITQNYNGRIQIHLPKDTHFDKLSFESNAAIVNNNNIYTNTDILSVMADMGDIDLTIEDPLDSLYLHCDLGSISLTTEESIHQLDIESDFGTVNLTLNADLGSLSINENLGDIHLISGHSIEQLTVTNDLGNIDATLSGTVDGIYMSTNLGTIDVTIPSTINTVYAETNLGDVDSDFTRTRDSDTSPYSFYSDLGSIHISK